MAFLTEITFAHYGTATGYPIRVPASISKATSLGTKKCSGNWPTIPNASMRPSAMRGPVLTTILLSTVGKGDLVEGIFGSQVAH
jgi:hypothetical protein